jgi:predicted ATPase
MAFIRSFSIQADQQHPFPFNIPAVRFAKGIALGDQVTIFVGDNGCGKSTLLESLAYSIDIPLIGGRIGGASPSFAAAKTIKSYLEIDWQNQTQKGFFFRAEDFSHFIDNVDREMEKIAMELLDLKGKVDDSVIRQMRENMNYAGASMRKNYGVDVNTLSHGEAFLTILQTRVRDKGIFILDEPEAALSPLKQLSLLAFILEVLKSGKTQFIIATHSPILMGIPDAVLYEIREESMERVQYTETDHYRITKRFLVDPESYLRHLR